jgi:hypothetical protein
MKKKFTVLLLNLTSPSINLNRFREKSENIPLACGYLKAYAYASGLAEEVVIDLAPQSLMNKGGDLGIVSFISERDYDLVGFSLYQWNSLRSLAIMNEIKKRNHGIRLLAGGPEVSFGTDYLMKGNILDFMIEGEGEEPFQQLLHSLLDDGHSLEGIPGLIHRHKNRWMHTPPFSVQNDLSKIPSPYLLGFIDLDYHQTILLESMRGCLYNCRYCSWKRGGRCGISSFPIERLRQEVILAREKGIRILRFLDSGINISREHLKSMCEMLCQENRDRSLEIRSFLHCELIDEESAHWLSEANFKHAIIGLQSTNPEALKAIGRKADLDAYLRGTSLLRDHGIDFVSTIIAGLPGDTPLGFSKTMDFLLSHGQRNVICFPLSVAPNTQFRDEAQSLQIQYQEMPPNYVISTPTMDYGSLRGCLLLYLEKFSSFAQIPYSEIFPSFITYAQGRYPRNKGKKYSGISLEQALSSRPLYPLTRILLSRECREADDRDIEKMAQILAPRLSWNTLFWCFDSGSPGDGAFMKRFLPLVSRDNPFHIWHIVLEFEKEAALDFLSEIHSSISSGPNHLDYESLYEEKEARRQYVQRGPHVYAIVPFDSTEFSREWVLRLSEKLPLFWSLRLPAITVEIPHFGEGYVMDFSPDILPSQILYTLNTVANSTDKPCFFRNWVIQRLWSLFSIRHLSIWGSDETLLQIRDNSDVFYTRFSDHFLRKHIQSWIRSRNRRCQA